jgi:hypothetical protein
VQKRTWVFGRPAGASRDARAIYHPMCAVDVDLASAYELIERDPTEFADRASVSSVVVVRMRAAIALAAQARGGAPVDRAALEAVEPARDARGRPRVRVLFAGSAVARGARLASLVRSLAFIGSWTSPIREYCMVLPDNEGGEPVARRPGDDDPSQPVVGAVFAVLDGVTVLPSERASLLEWNSRSLPTPVLWIASRRRTRVHVRAAVARDDEVLRYRRVLDDCGFSGDEALVVRHADDQASALDSLVAALDESIDRVGAPTIDARSPIERMAEQIHSLLDLERDVGLRQVLSRAKMLVASASEGDQAALCEAASRALFSGAGFRLSFDILREATRCDPSDTMLRWLGESLADGRPFDDYVDDAIRLVRERSPASLLATLESLREREEDTTRLLWLEREIARTQTSLLRRRARSNGDGPQ